VLEHVCLGVKAGGALVLVGPNGAGKSTLLRVLAGLKRVDAGWVRFDGAADYAGRAAFLGHQDAVKPGLTVAENLEFAAAAMFKEGAPAARGGDVAAALAGVGLAGLAGLPARMLSAGQRRRVALARLGLLGAPLWLLDEPTVGLDAAAIARFGVALAAHRDAGGVVVAATHVELPLPGAETLVLGGAA